MHANANLTTALEFHQAGRYADAARCYHDLLAHEPENAEALHLFGVMHHQCGHSRRAVELIGRAAACGPVPRHSTPIWPRLIAASASTNRRSIAVVPLGAAAPLPRGGQQSRPGLDRSVAM